MHPQIDSPPASPLAYRSLPPKNGGKAEFVVLLLHGVGANGADLLDLAWHWRDLLPNTEFISADAPQPFDLMDEALDALPEFAARQWFSLAGIYGEFAAIGVDAIPTMQERAAVTLPILHDFIAHILATRNLPPHRLALVGFSQGTMMGLEAVLSYTPALAGMVGYSGVLLAKDASELAPKNRPPILLVHGQKDEVVPVTALAHSESLLREAGVPVIAIASPSLGHSIDAEGLMAGGHFLQKCAAKSA